jgi:hypothetical protein
MEAVLRLQTEAAIQEELSCNVRTMSSMGSVCL